MKKTNNTQKINEKGIIDVLEAKIKLYKKEIAIAVGAVIVAAAIFGLISHLKERSYQKQWGDLFLAELPIAAAQDGQTADLSSLEAYAAENEKTDAGVYAAFTLGNAYYQNKDYQKAELYFKQAIKNANKDLKALAETSLIATFVAQEAYEKAIEQANAFIAKYPAHFALAQVKTHKALATELSGKPQEAKILYQEIIEQYPASYSSALAEVQASKIQ